MTEPSIYNNKDWVMRPEEAASEITGENMNLGNDICIYFKMCGYEQGVFDRLAKQPGQTLADELRTDKGYVMLGNPEKIRKAMHDWVDGLINASTEFRKTEALKRQNGAK